MPESNKLINNGYLRATPSHIVSSTGGSGTGINNNDDVIGCIADVDGDNNSAMLEDVTATVVSPLLGSESETLTASQVENLPLTMQNNTNSSALSSPLLQRTSTGGASINGLHNKLPTVVYLGTADPTGATTALGGSGGSMSGMPRTVAMQRNSPIGYNNNTSTNTSSTTHHPTQSSDWLLKEPALRRRLLILAVAFTVLGAAIGALAIYFAGSYRCSPSDTNLQPMSFGDGSLIAGNSVCLTEECVRTAASLLSAMDTTADPCDNFFQYACGTWNKMHIIPEDRSSISTFEVLADQLQVILKGVLEEPVSELDNQATIKAKMFYKSCMDLPQIRKIGEGNLKEVLRSLGGWPVIEPNWSPPTNLTVEQLMGFLRGNYSEPVLVELYVGADDKNSSVNILQIDQLQLALPSRDYYLKASSENDLKAYHKYMTHTAILMGANPETAAKELDDVVQFEIKLVNASLPEADRHDTSAIYKKISLSELQDQVPELNWTEYLQTSLGEDIHLEKDEMLVSYAMPYLIEMGKILKESDRRVVHNYVLWRLVMSIMTHMIDEYQRERVEFRKILLGIQSERMRWSQCVEWTNKKLGMAVGALFIHDNFNQESKDTALEIIHTIREAFNDLLAENHWMDDETRAVAKEKANAMNERIGYPEILTNATELEKEYVNLTIVKDNFMENVLNILKWDSAKNLQLLRLPVDKEKWTTEPAVVNAFYNPNKNDIVFPAGILQPLFYSQNFPKSLNYGGIGVVIGHEITHGFDDKGRQFDKDGNMMQWWNNATVEAFRKRTQCIIDQYSKYKIDEVGMYMDGRMTQGENIADNGGLKQAFRAYKKWVKLHGPEPELPGLNLTHDQLFFLNYAQIWCGSMRPEDALTKIRSSVHSPGFIRVLAPLSNSKDFAKAYQCPLGSPMNPVEKCSVW